MSMYNDIVWGEKGNREACVANSLLILLENSRKDTGVVSWARIRKEVVRNSRIQTKWRMGRCR